MAIFLAALCLLSLVVAAGGSWPLADGSYENYIVVVDCGSTGSRAHVFTYPPRIRFANSTLWRRKIVSGSPVSYPREIAHFKSQPGIASFADNPSGVAEGLKSIIDSAAEALRQHNPKLDLTDVPVYMGATAGMRMLTDPQRDALMLVVRGFLSGPECPFGFQRQEQARVLAGEEEGAFGWLAANHKLGTLTSDAHISFGALDMGGASTQISFIPYQTSVLAHMFPIHIGYFRTGPIHLYSHSFLRFGYSAAFKRSALLASLGGSTFEHPCLPRGLVWYVNEGEFGIGGRRGQPEREAGPVTMSGGGSFWQCQTLARSLMVQSYCATKPCALLGVYVPDFRHTSFLAFSEFKKNFERMNITTDTVAPPLQALRARLVTWCSMSLEEQAAFNNEKMGTWKAKIELSCWLGVWILEYLTTGLGFDMDSRNIKLYGSDYDIGWAQGQAIYETSFMPYKLVEEASGRRRRRRGGEELPLDPAAAEPNVSLLSAEAEWAGASRPDIEQVAAGADGADVSQLLGAVPAGAVPVTAALVLGVALGRLTERQQARRSHGSAALLG